MASPVVSFDQLLSAVRTKTTVSDQTKEILKALNAAVLCSLMNYSVIINSIKLYMFSEIKLSKSDMRFMFDNGFAAMSIVRCAVFRVHQEIISCIHTIHASIISDMIYSWYIYEETLVADMRIVCNDYLTRYYAKSLAKDTQIEYLNKRVCNYREYVDIMQKRMELL